MNNRETLIKRLVRHPDERGFFQELIRSSDEFFSEGFAQLSMSRMNTGVIKAWHMHRKQVDWWFVPKGNIKAVLAQPPEIPFNDYQIQEFLMGEDYEPIVLRIPPGVFHGCKVLSGPADLIYVTSREYDGTDELRALVDHPAIGYDWGQEIK